MTTGEKIRYHRERLGLTMAELGELVGVQASAINKYEKGRVVNIKKETIAKMAAVFGISQMELLDDIAMDYYISVDAYEKNFEDSRRYYLQTLLNNSKLSESDLDKIISYVEFIGDKNGNED